MNKNETNGGIVDSAEAQSLKFLKAKKDKIEEVEQERQKLINYRRVLSNIIYMVGSSYRELYPQAEGFIEGRIKSLDSLNIKTKNEITEILNKIKADPNIDQKIILDEISKIDFKDLFAFSVVTSKTQKVFKTGNDECDREFAEYGREIETSERRMIDHENFTNENEQLFLEHKNAVNELKLKEEISLSEANKKDKIQELTEDMIKSIPNMSEAETERFIRDTISNIVEIAESESKETIHMRIEEHKKLQELFKKYINYGNKNIKRTLNVLQKYLRDLQYKMSKYFVSTLDLKSAFKFLGTKKIRSPKEMIKPGFRATNTGYTITYTDRDTDDKIDIKFEAQGKGEIDYNDAEFSAEGASYHEEQKTEEGIISKNIEMPDFTIIGKEKTKEIEDNTRLKYEDINSTNDFEEEGIYDKFAGLKDMLEAYKDKVKKELIDKYGDNDISKEKIKKKNKEIFKIAKENCIQKEIDEEINRCIDEEADGAEFIQRINSNEDLKTIYEDEYKKIESRYSDVEDNVTVPSVEEIEHKARIRVLYKNKEDEIREYAQSAIPSFFKVQLSRCDNLKEKDNNFQEADEGIMIYWYTTGESIYRFFINRLNGLKYANGEYKYKKEEQQKRALLRLEGLFEENEDNFYIWNEKTKSFGSFCNTRSSDSDER